ncbi:MAG: thioredoxin-disulfide reductase [Syntrophobacterales bacterium]|jgi:thioredoxin reductase (NADPH)|nr:thioredoxin-disulfide reductase [Syntrophobacterales bacterium]
MGEKPDIWDVLIVGGGPAGYTAGLYAARANLKVQLIEGASTVSQITTTDWLENYPGIPGGTGGFELVEMFRNQAVSFGLSVTQADCTALLPAAWEGRQGWIVQAGEQSFNALSVIVATGAHWRKLAVPGEERYTGRGVSYCATCDGAFFRNRDVVVVGGGDTAVQEAIFLTKFVSGVTIVHRRERLRATAILQERALANEKISFIWNAVVEEISGTETVTNVRLRDAGNEKKIWDIPASGVFVFIGLNPNSGLVKGHAALGDDGAILVDPQMRTSAKGVFACGDCTQKLLRQVVTACGDGATAAFSAQLYVEELKGVAY